MYSQLARVNVGFLKAVQAFIFPLVSKLGPITATSISLSYQC